MPSRGLVIVSALAFAASAGSDALELPLAKADVASVAFMENEDGAALTLIAPAAAKLARITDQNRGRMLVVSIEGIEAARATIVGKIDSGIVRVQRPSPELRALLREIESERAGRR